MNLHAYKQLTGWLSAIGVKTLGQLKAFKKRYTDGTQVDLLDHAFGCYIFNIEWED